MELIVTTAAANQNARFVPHALHPARQTEKAATKKAAFFRKRLEVRTGP